ncbi:GntR family transcriptional regulator [Brevibacillus choshinensis]|uniref:GntR family transcriptional regulator n=1 Tax=Brevibacillus choshinensis TaxID=54911 RepID=A0ABX7FTJ5_BRECH|nr:GntR family transcriptional regulator [Brevibacillus choshinensis]QRG68290.1 GntR family transcriptional regulator [Brevibacillus choshinensis]
MPIPKDIAKVEKASTKNRVLHMLQNWIIDGTLKPGEKILDKELVELLGVSRTPIREALQNLQTLGFVEISHGKDTRVTALQPDELSDLFPTLAGLEALASKMATKKADDELIHQLTEINEQFLQAIQANDKNMAIDLDEQFHSMIVAKANNKYITEFTAVLHLHMKRFKYIYFTPSMLPAMESYKEHQQIIEALKTRDETKAALLLEQNWLRGMETVSNYIHGQLS